MVKNMRGAIFGDETSKPLLKKINEKPRCTHYKACDMGTDALDRGHGKFAFHNRINTWEFATNSSVSRERILQTADATYSCFTVR